MSVDESFRFFSTPLQVATVWLSLVITSISVAYVSHLCREQYAELVGLEASANQMQIDYGRYLLEQSAWGSLQRIETSAIEKFSMHSPKSAEIVIVRNP
ncbi:MAG: Cell division protein FtsL [Porticoccaceae bacterium UBA1117]|jgi:cell division protein FtsL|nr:MAG: Cell division protein FtsL [Porticoccaceae bacterium UBA1117]